MSAAGVGASTTVLGRAGIGLRGRAPREMEGDLESGGGSLRGGGGRKTSGEEEIPGLEGVRASIEGAARVGRAVVLVGGLVAAR